MKLPVNINAESAGVAYAESIDNRMKSEVEELGFTTDNDEHAKIVSMLQIAYQKQPAAPSEVEVQVVPQVERESEKAMDKAR